ncbi:MAG TPA: ATP-dependent DNA helicase RecG [Lachnospiraceae bacterium]|nr:ATP-dependent DNA helicase RecG [Lachnospiraceae bacterium]
MREQDSIRVLKGIGEKSEKLFAKLGLFTVGDLIQYYPREYDLYRHPVSVGELKVGEKGAVLAAVTFPVDIKNTGKLTVITTTVQDATGRLALTWFNMPFLRSTLKRGSVYVFRGRVTEKMNRRVMEQPEIFTVGAYDGVCDSMQPLYGLTAGLSNKLVTKTVRQALESVQIEEWLPETLAERLGLIPLGQALWQIHFPATQQEFLEARRRLAFGEFFLFILCMQMMKERQTDTENNYPMKAGWKTEEVMESLPYRLTDAQMRVWTQMEEELAGNRLMNRLIQGDVGSGKTILAFLAMIMAAENGYQSALMAPTEVLAHQHYEDFVTLLEENGLEEYRPVLLTGSCTAKEKRNIYEKIAIGYAKCIIGTHALIQDAVEYDNLSLVITDEQHRFGVKQRETFSAKGGKPNIAVMSATPIPRTLAMILYGDLDISVLDEKPARRLPIKNCVVDTSYRPTAYRFIRRELTAGHQVYVICPMVEASEEIKAENVTDYAKKLKKEFPEFTIGLLHGRMKPAAKDQIMDDFSRGDIHILVSTTVVEVGVNVPNATVMMVENAERFGLAQLHQLRGRVGRGEDQSYCIFIRTSDGDANAKRLDILNKTNDGFAIADEDLRLRGPGDFFGIRQSGLMEFAIGDIYRDSELLRQAAQEVKRLLVTDPELELEEHGFLAAQVAEYRERKLQDVIL